MWKAVISSNLNSLLKLFFYSPILANNNLLLNIYCENIVVAIGSRFTVQTQNVWDVGSMSPVQ